MTKILLNGEYDASLISSQLLPFVLVSVEMNMHPRQVTPFGQYNLSWMLDSLQLV